VREIKFRAWDFLEKRMFYDVHNTYDNSAGDKQPPERSFGEVIEAVIRDWDSERWWDTKGSPFRYAVMQYTGLKDKNGVEACYDDIIDDGVNKPFALQADTPFNFYHLLAALSEIKFEIIGNIYENLELLHES